MGAMKNLSSDSLGDLIRLCNANRAEADRLRDQKHELYKALKRIIARAEYRDSDTNADRVRDLAHIEAIARVAVDLDDRSR